MVRKMFPNSYKDAGVDIDAGNELVNNIKNLTKKTYRKELFGELGGFSGISSLPVGLKDPLLVSSTDGVGTKLRLAFLTKKHNTVGIDLVAMVVNDIITCGADPLFFLDYFACGKLDINIANDVIEGIVNGCCEAGCMLIGGETAEMPGSYPKEEYDLAGFGVGVVEKTKLVNGKNIKSGDVVIGLPSSGLHSNGFSLVRKILLNEINNINRYNSSLEKTIGEELLIPTKIYVKDIKLLSELEIKGMVHITGGGLIDNPPRCISENLSFRFFNNWKIPPIMKLIAKKGKISEMEMRKTFNMGLGFLIILSEKDAEKALNILKNDNIKVVGEIIKRENEQVIFG